MSELDNMINKNMLGNNLELFKKIPDESIDLIITSPPYYQQRDYGKGLGLDDTIQDYIFSLLNIFSECVRVLKNSGHIIYNLGDKYIDGDLLLVPYKFALKVKEKFPSLYLINNITWIKPNPTPRQFKGRLVSATEPFFDFVKSKKYKYNPDDFLKNELTKSNDKRIISDKKGKNYVKMINETQFLSTEEKKKALKSIDQMLKEMKDRKIDDFRMKIRGIHAAAYGGHEGGRKSEIEKNGFTMIRMYGKKMKKDYIICAKETIPNSKHPAIYPKNLIKEFILLSSDRNDIVLDPYMGSGSTAIACLETNRKFIGFENQEKFVKFSNERIKDFKNCQSNQKKLEVFIRKASL